MLAGFNHVALITEDMDRFIAFYTEVFEAKVHFDLDEGELRHAMLDIGGGAALHPFTVPGRDGRGSSEMFGRGHLDHFALNCPDEETFERVRRRLVEHGACDGTVTDWGAIKTCTFRDPDGMELEIALWEDGEPLRFEDRIEEPFEA